jgi:hypothetical protein
MPPALRLLLGALLLAAPAPAFAGVTCPLKIQVTQQLAAQGPGWKVGTTGWPAALTALSVFDGTPENHYALRQDDERQDEKTWTVIWNLPPRPHPYWITCRYANTTITLSRPLPATVTRCELVHELEITSADGGLVVRSMDCGPAE